MVNGLMDPLMNGPYYVQVTQLVGYPQQTAEYHRVVANLEALAEHRSALWTACSESEMMRDGSLSPLAVLIPTIDPPPSDREYWRHGAGKGMEKVELFCFWCDLSQDTS